MAEWLTRKSDAQIRAEAIRKLRRMCDRETLFRIPGEGKPGEWRTITTPYSTDVAAFLRRKYPKVIIANEDLVEASKYVNLVGYEHN